MPNDQQSSRKWRKKPTVIEAVQWDGGNIGEVMSLGPMRGEVDAGALFIDTLEGRMRADPGDWIIKGVKGEFYPCKPDIFTALHEPESSASSETGRYEPNGRDRAALALFPLPWSTTEAGFVRAANGMIVDIAVCGEVVTACVNSLLGERPLLSKETTK